MAKKHRASTFSFGRNAVEKRKATHTIKSLGDQMARLKIAFEDLESTIDVMKSLGIKEIEVDGAAKFNNGMKSIDEYLERARMGVAKISLVPKQKMRKHLSSRN